MRCALALLPLIAWRARARSALASLRVCVPTGAQRQHAGSERQSCMRTRAPAGVNVSGGQKQRIQIARAVYAAADVVLLDDPLSALDAKVGRRVFERAICGALADRTRLLVTNQLQYVPRADLVLVLKGGKVAEAGRPDELSARPGGALAELMRDVRADDGDGAGSGGSGESGADGDGADGDDDVGGVVEAASDGAT